MAKVVYSRQARADLSQIWAWIARSSGERRPDVVVDRIIRILDAASDVYRRLGG